MPLIFFLLLIMMVPAWSIQAGDSLSWVGCSITKTAFMSEVAKAFQQETGITTNLAGGGAIKGIREVANHHVQLGGTCRHLILDEAEKGVKLHPVAWDALVVIAHPDTAITNISHDQLRDVLVGKITNWKDLGGEDRPIVLVLRDNKQAGVELMIRELLFGDPTVEFKSTLPMEDSGRLEKTIKDTPNAIGVTGVSSARREEGLKILDLDGISPTHDHIAAGIYPLFRPIYLVADDHPSTEVKRFLAFIKSDHGQKIISATGTVNLQEGEKLWRPYREHMKHVIRSNKGIFN